MNSVNKRSRKRESGTSYFLFGIVLLCATLAFVIFGRLDAPWHAFAALGAGAALGIWLLRFGSRHAWVSLLCLFAALAVCVVLFMSADTVGSAGIAWIGAFVAGTNLGAAWRLFAKKSKARAVRILAPRIPALARIRLIQIQTASGGTLPDFFLECMREKLQEGDCVFADCSQ